MMGAACNQAPPSPAGPSSASTDFAVTSVAPTFAKPGSNVRIVGSGFGAGATVTMGGVAARILSSNNSSTINVTAPDHEGGVVDVVVNNADGRHATLAGAFRYTTVTVSVSATVVSAGGELTVSWNVPDQGESSFVRGAEDYISLWNVNGRFVLAWETTGMPSGTRTLNAPMEPGQYEFQYKDFNDVRTPYDRIMGRSSVITVTPAGTSGSLPHP
jgi:hypothetical protein